MEPFKSLVPVANWMLRISLGIIVYTKYFDTVMKFSFNTAYYFIALAFVIFTILLFVGGLVRKNTTTVIAGFIILGLSIAMMFIGGFTVTKLLSHFTTAAIGCYFLSRGNRG